MHQPSALGRGIAVALAVAAFAFLMNGCGPDDTLDLADIGIGVTSDIQAGGTYDLTFRAPDNVLVDIASVPAGTMAELRPAAGSSYRLLVRVDSDTPRGDYNLGIQATINGETQLIGWPFTVTEP